MKIIVYILVRIILFLVFIPIAKKIAKKIVIEKDQEVIKLKKLLKEAVEEKQRANALNQGLNKDIDELYKALQSLRIKNQQINEAQNQQVSEDTRLNNIRSCCQSSDTSQNTINLQNELDELKRDYFYAQIRAQIMDTQSTINAGMANLYASTYPYSQMMPSEMIMATAILHTPYGG